MLLIYLLFKAMTQKKSWLERSRRDTESIPANIRPDETQSPLPPMLSPCFPKSVSLADLLKARKLVKPKNQIICTLYLETYNVAKKEWETLMPTPIQFTMDSEKFSEGGFRDAFMATTSQSGLPGKWVIKQYKDDKMESIEH